MSKNYLISKEVYKRHKLEEINFLKSNIANKLDSFNVISESDIYSEVIQKKIALRKIYFHSFYEQFSQLTETNFSLSEATQRIGEVEFNYGYQRFDLRLLKFNGIKDIYGFKGDFSSSTFMTNCGMSAISSFFLGLKETVGSSIEIVHRSDIYFETIHLIKNYFSFIQKIEINQDKINKIRILYLDSISSKVMILEDCNEIDIVVFDTTCFEVEDVRIKEVINYFSKKSCVLVLVRSHIKLDFMGIEIGKLGSLVLITGEGGSFGHKRLYENLVGWIRDVISRFGFTFDLSHFYPIQFDEQFRSLNKRRVHQINQNTKELFSILSSTLDERFLVKSYDHSLFVTVGVMSLPEREDLKKLKSRIVKKYENEGVQVREAGSFGFDFIAMDNYKELGTNIETIRISMSDIDENALKGFSEVLISEFLKNVK